MYALVRQYRFNPRYAEEINRKVREGFLPLIQKAPGFIGYYWLDTEEGVGASVSLFEDAATAQASVRLAADFVRENLVSLIGTPETLKGEVRAHANRETLDAPTAAEPASPAPTHVPHIVFAGR